MHDGIYEVRKDIGINLQARGLTFCICLYCTKVHTRQSSSSFITMVASKRLFLTGTSIFARASPQFVPVRTPRQIPRSCTRCYATEKTEYSEYPEPVRLLSEVDARGKPIKGFAGPAQKKRGGPTFVKTRLLIGSIFMGILIWDMVRLRFAEYKHQLTLK